MISYSAAAPELYGLPKIHKDNTPLRPISSSQKVPCYWLAKYLGTILQKAVSTEYNIKNSIELKEKLQNIQIDEDEIIVSFDVVSLFTNIPVQLAITNIMKKWNIYKEETKMTRKQFLEILKFCLIDNNYFTYNGQYYQQTYGMPMGNPLSPTIANIVLDTLLDDVITELNKSNVTIKMVTKYVDDLFAIIKRDDEKLIMEKLNSYHNKLKFTVEKEQDGKIAYLDINIIKDNGKLITNWYTKETASGRVINYHSTQPRTMKKNTAINLIRKVIDISDERYKYKNIQKIKNILIMNSYPIHMVQNYIHSALNNKKTKDNENTTEQKTFYSVPYIPELTESRTLKSVMNNTQISIAHRSNETLKQLFTRKKTKLDKLKVDNVVYEIECNGNERERCNMIYIGTTKRTLGIRIAEHEADVNKGKESTALAQHIKETGHNMNFKEVKILDKERKENKRYILESLRIQQKIKNTMNTKEDKNNTKLHYQVAI